MREREIERERGREGERERERGRGEEGRETQRVCERRGRHDIKYRMGKVERKTNLQAENRE